MPTEPSVLWAHTGSISHNMNEDNVAQLMRFVQRMPDEFQVVTVRETMRKHKALAKNPSIAKWVAACGDKFFA